MSIVDTHLDPNRALVEDSVSAMEVAATTTTSRGPFQREVREWQHVDPNTGALLTGRLEADRWVNGPLNSYGKVGDFWEVVSGAYL